MQAASFALLLLQVPVSTGPWGKERAENFRAPSADWLNAQLMDARAQEYYAGTRPYLAKPLEELVVDLPELKGLQPAADQQTLPNILSKTGERVRIFFDDIVDLLAHEDIEEQRLNQKGSVRSKQHLRYDYLILLHRDELPIRVEELRIDAHGDRTEPQGFEDGYATTSGFALRCIHFLPSQRSDSTFRYLGDQIVGSRDTYVMAFAQRPGQSTSVDYASGEWGIVALLVQGIAWIDKTSFEIIQLRTDLLAPRSDIGLAQQTTLITFKPVKLPDVDTPFWLPEDVSVYAKFRNQIFRNEHRYADYQRYRVAVKMVNQ
jgi:hypothetical protein